MRAFFTSDSVVFDLAIDLFAGLVVDSGRMEHSSMRGKVYVVNCNNRHY